MSEAQRPNLRVRKATSASLPARALPPCFERYQRHVEKKRDRAPSLVLPATFELA